MAQFTWNNTPNIFFRTQDGTGPSVVARCTEDWPEWELTGMSRVLSSPDTSGSLTTWRGSREGRNYVRA
jgi:hypothetical protein